MLRAMATTTSDLDPTAFRQLAPELARLRAPNPGPMTGRGTNTYLLGADEVIVIDPGPELDVHIDSILRHAAGPIRLILTTHTHRDHSPAAHALAARCGAVVAGMPAPSCGRQDTAYAPDRVLRDGELVTAGAVDLLAVHTPGHASNHLCFWQPESGTLFSGDHIIAGSTVVIDPPDGDMGQYLCSLQKIRALGARCIMPGHGEPLTDPEAAIDALTAHRLGREAKVTAALPVGAACSLDALTVAVYDDVDPRLHPVAARSLLAHLLKLEAENRATRDDDGRWRRP
jgi:glyoxylase-like metal-dependent hydrolase (beta-lactamase superfamily II)